MTAITDVTGAAHARIMGIGAYRPTRLVPNSEVVDAIDSSDEWIQQRSGIKTRRWAGPEESVQMMSVEASRIAIERSGLDVGQIDCVVVATVSHLLQTPAVATAIAYELGTDAAAFDISAACSGFCHGISLASDFVRAGPAVALKPDGRKRFIAAYERRLSHEITHPQFGYRISYRRLLEVQARLLGRWLLGEIPEYPQFVTR